jgi:hypothetical protein
VANKVWETELRVRAGSAVLLLDNDRANISNQAGKKKQIR